MREDGIEPTLFAWEANVPPITLFSLKRIYNILNT